VPRGVYDRSRMRVGLRCGHPDTMENLYWHRLPHWRSQDLAFELGGKWDCRECTLERASRWAETIPGMLSHMKASLKYEAKNRSV
jgi:hypothetical protein